MPYASVSELPAHVKKYPSKIQRMWMAVWNSVHKKTNSEARAFKAANAVFKKNMEKFGGSRYGEKAFFAHLIDKFEGKLNG